MKAILVATFSPVFLVAPLAVICSAALPPITINAPPTVVRDYQRIYENYILNVSSGGVVGNQVFVDYGGKVNVSGGTIGYNFFATSFTEVTITGGEFGSGFFGGGSAGGFTKISGGTFGPGFSLVGDATELIGGEFRLNGTAVSGIAHIPSISDVFSGTLKDGTVFILSGVVQDGFANIGVKLTPVALPAPPVSPLTVSANNGPRGLRAGKTLNLVSGGTLINNFAAVDATLNISGGDAGDGLEVVGSQVSITGGRIRGFHAFNGSNINISGGNFQSGSDLSALQGCAGTTIGITAGEFDGPVVANSGSHWNISNGRFGYDFNANAGSDVKISGGRFRSFAAADSSSVTISGGQFEPYFNATGSGVAIQGGEFLLNGLPYTRTGVTLAPTDVLTGVLPDGNEFIFSPMEYDALTNVSLVQRAIPAAGSSPTTVDSVNAPRALRAGQTINLIAGGVLPDLFPIASGTLNVVGGTAGSGLKADRSQITVISGSMGDIALFNSNMSVQGGTVGGFTADYSHVDILPGSTSNGFTARAGSTVNMSGGTINAWTNAFVEYGAVFTMTGGDLQGYLDVSANSVAHLSNGNINNVRAEQYSSLDVNNATIYSLYTSDNTTIELTNATITSGASFSGNVNFYSGSLPSRSAAGELGLVNIRGGTVGSSFTAGGFRSVVNIMGGSVGASFTANSQSTVNISGGTVGNLFTANGACTVNIMGGVVGSGFNANSSSKVNISGGTVGATFNANSGSTVNISAGTVGDGFNANSGSTVNISGGSVGAMFDAFTGTSVNLTGGSVGPKVNVAGGTFKIAGGTIGDNALVTSLVSTARAKLTMSSGSIGNGFRVQGYFSQPNPNIAPVIGPATVEISGGTVGSGFAAGVSSIVNISGGTFGDLFVAEKGSTINLLGTSFLINGDPIPSLTRDVPYTVGARDVTLSGFLVDGSPFSFDLYSTGTTTDRFDPLATLTVTLKAAAVPEPAMSAFMLFAMSAAVGGNRVRCFRRCS